MALPDLLGPPAHCTGRLKRPRDQPSPADPFIDSMVANFDRSMKPTRGFTENNSPTFVSTGNPCLDFFFHVVQDTPPDSLIQRLHLSWEFNPVTTMKLICNLRGVRGIGKSDKEGFYTAAMWLYHHHPKTLVCNIPSMAYFGYFKDLPEILYRLLEGPDVRSKQKEEWMERKGRKMPTLRNRRSSSKRERSARNNWRRNKNRYAYSSDWDVTVDDIEKAKKKKKENHSLAKKDKWIAMAKKFLQRYDQDSDFRSLYQQISKFFAESLKADLEILRSGQLYKISLASKWCPSIDSSYDRSALLCENIARMVFPRESSPEYEGIEEAHYAYRVRDRLRKEVLVPLRKALQLPEVYMGAKRWHRIPYNRVASLAMTNYKKTFLKHDQERFYHYLEDVGAGKAKISAGALLPHEIINSLDELDGEEVAELQWRRMVEDLLKEGKMRNCISICDVSGSMIGIPMAVCVALGILVSELSENPWKGKVITFSQSPMLHIVKGNSLRKKMLSIEEMHCAGNTDFQKVFDLILKVAVDGGLKNEQMIKRVFVFSDMEFDDARGESRTPPRRENPRRKWNDETGSWYWASEGESDEEENKDWETDYQVIERKFREKGYATVPEIVFWNLRHSRATPVPARQKGVALVSGFSKNMLKLFLNNDGIVSPECVMEAAISGAEYQNLIVLD